MSIPNETCVIHEDDARLVEGICEACGETATLSYVEEYEAYVSDCCFVETTPFGAYYEP